MRKIRFPRRAGIVLTVIALTISGCGDFQETHNPTVSDLSLSPEAMGEVNRISIPMPIPAPAQPPKRAEAASLWGARTPQLFQDRRAEDVGDLVTVLIDINRIYWISTPQLAAAKSWGWKAVRRPMAKALYVAMNQSVCGSPR